MEKHDANGRWIATQLESAFLNTVARIQRIKVKRSRKSAKRRVPIKSVRPEYAAIAARTIKPEYAGDWAGGEFDHDDHLARIAARAGLTLMQQK